MSDPPSSPTAVASPGTASLASPGAGLYSPFKGGSVQGHQYSPFRSSPLVRHPPRSVSFAAEPPIAAAAVPVAIVLRQVSSIDVERVRLNADARSSDHANLHRISGPDVALPCTDEGIFDEVDGVVQLEVH